MNKHPLEPQKAEGQSEAIIVAQTYSPDIPKNYSPEPEGNYSPGAMASPNNSFGGEGASLPHVEMLQMSDESNSFDNQFYLSVAPNAIQVYDDNFPTTQAFYDTAIPYKYE